MAWMVIAVAVAIFGVFVAAEARARLRLRALAARGNLSEELMVKLWQRQDLTVVKQIAKDLGFQAGRLRPDDQLSVFDTPGVGDDPKVEAVFDRIRAREGTPEWNRLIYLSEIVDYLDDRRMPPGG